MTDKVASIKERAKGMLAAIPTVFDGKGEPDLPTIEQLVEFYMKAGVDGFFVLGSQGQGAACRIDQRKAVAETVIRRVGGRVPVIVQVGCADPYSSVELGAHAKSVGADAIGIVGPYYYSDRNEWELTEHYRLIDKAADLPILLYNNERYSGYPCPPAFMAKLRELIPNVFGAKLADGNVVQANQYLKTLSKDFTLFLPITEMVPGMAIGASGSIAAGAPVTVPEVGVALIAAILAGDNDRALRLQALIFAHMQRMTPLRAYGRRTTYEGLRIRGIDVKEYPRWPTKPMPAADQKIMENNINILLSEVNAISAKAAAE